MGVCHFQGFSHRTENNERLETFRKGSATLKEWMEESARYLNVLNDQKASSEKVVADLETQIAQVKKECDDLEREDSVLHSVVFNEFGLIYRS